MNHGGDNGFTLETFVRNVPFRVKSQLSQILDPEKKWEQLAKEIPKDCKQLFKDSHNFQGKYSFQQIQWITMMCKKQGTSETAYLLSDWGTLNCQTKHLLQALENASLYGAVKCLKENMRLVVAPISPGQRRKSGLYPLQSVCALRQALGETQDDIGPDKKGKGSEAGISVDQASSEQNTLINVVDIESGRKVSGELGAAKLPDSQVEKQKSREPEESIDMGHLKNFQYNLLRKITNNFDHRDACNGGNLLGEGGFGSVFYGVFHSNYPVAVKRLKKDDKSDSHSSPSCQTQFVTEVETLKEFKHENLVYLLGYCDDGEFMCLVYQYLPNGSLEDRLACKHNTPPLSSALRIDISKGTANGLLYLHSRNLTHRDVKSANILLDANFIPKLGDFATAKVLPENFTKSVSTVIGSRPYMAPEANSFKVHTGLDIFSFGVVLLELLTGLKVFDNSREESDLKSHVKEFCAPADEDDSEEETGSIFDLLDQKAGKWDHNNVEILYELSEHCLVDRRKLRISTIKLVERLQKLKIKSQIRES